LNGTKNYHFSGAFGDGFWGALAYFNFPSFSSFGSRWHSTPLPHHIFPGKPVQLPLK
jgi:hypothetical protein